MPREGAAVQDGQTGSVHKNEECTRFSLDLNVL